MLEPEIVRKCEGHHDTVSAISFSPTGKQVASASMDSTIMIWNSAGDMPNRPAQNNSRKARAYRYEDHKDAVYTDLVKKEKIVKIDKLAKFLIQLMSQKILFLSNPFLTTLNSPQTVNF